MNKRCYILSLLMVVLILSVCPTTGLALSFYGNGVWGDFTGELGYSYVDASNATLSVELTNTSSVANGGYITAFVLNNPSNLISGVSISSFTDSDFNLIFANNGINGMPYGQFDIGASLGTNPNSNFADNGDPSDGIEVGDTETFTFSLTGTGLNGLSEQSFVDELSVSASPEQENQFLVVRFRGFEDDGSDKVPAVPEPATMLLLGPALLGLIGLKRRKA